MWGAGQVRGRGKPRPRTCGGAEARRARRRRALRRWTPGQPAVVANGPATVPLLDRTKIWAGRGFGTPVRRRTSNVPPVAGATAGVTAPVIPVIGAPATTVPFGPAAASRIDTVPP